MGLDDPSSLNSMTAGPKLDLISIDDYLAGELVSPIKHEYLGGFVYAMAGARNVHNIIAVNIVTSFRVRLRGNKCRPYNSDTKIRVQLPWQVRFYYPDASVVCQPNPQDDSYQDAPVVLIEVLSRSTRRIDEGEKKDAYFTIPSLQTYLLVEQELPAVVAYRRTEQGFVRVLYTGLEANILLTEIDIELPLTEIYEDVEFIPEAD
jgi:Uma2 family endonuclease